jgi:hypothetical protein
MTDPVGSDPTDYDLMNDVRNIWTERNTLLAASYDTKEPLATPSTTAVATGVCPGKANNRPATMSSIEEEEERRGQVVQRIIIIY